MCIFTALIFCFSFAAVFGSKCEDISGFWQNQLGSNMTIIKRSNNQITGEYSTAVESRMRAALVTSNITGLYMQVDGGALISFSVLFNHGKSLTTWVGQCMECGGEEILYTSWNLRTHFLKPTDRWMATRINQDTFRRVKGDASNNIPSHLRTLGPSKKDEKSATCEKNIGAGFTGHWVSESSDVLQFSECFESGIFSGLNHESSIFGRSDGGGPFTALGFVSASEKSIRGWTGHIYESSSEKRKIETSWLTHDFSDSCQNPRNLVRFGMDEYTFTYGYEEKKKTKESVWRNFLHYVKSLF